MEIHVCYITVSLTPSTFTVLGHGRGDESTEKKRPQPFVRITLYSQEELKHYRLDQSDLEHPGDFDERPSGSEIEEDKTPPVDSSEGDTGKLLSTNLLSHSNPL